MSGSMSGVAVDDECVQIYNDLKMKKSIRAAVFSIKGDKSAITCDPDRPPMAKSADHEHDWQEFISCLPEEPRYCVYDFEYEIPEGPRSKVIFVPWSPDEAGVKVKMLYASSKDALKKKFVGIQQECQANDMGDLEYHSIKAKVSQGGTK